MSLGAGNLLLASAGDEGYNLTRSLRFRRSASAYLNRTMTTPTDGTKWTYSVWRKLGDVGAAYDILLTARPGASAGSMQIVNGVLRWYGGATSAYDVISSQTWRDPSAWYHFVFAYDTTQATAANRIKYYVNGVQGTFSSATYPALNSVSGDFNAAHVCQFGADVNNGRYSDGQYAEAHFIDGQALTPSSFGSTNALTGVWQPARYTSTYGTNGFYLNFTDNSALTTSSNVGLGKDFSGNGNYWTTNNISITAGVTYDSMTDVPTLTSATASNFAVLNPLNPSRSTLTNGNLTASGTTDTPTIIPTSGTYYFEIDGVSKSWTPPAAFPAAAGNYNFGQRPFTNTPTGTLLNTFNLPTSTIVKGSDNMNIALDTGANIKTTTEALFSGLQFLEWIKDRANVNNHQLLNGVTGLSAVLQSNTTAAETTYTAPSGNSVGFAWKAGSSSSSNTSGSITSTVSVNASAGFSVVTYTAQASGTGTVGHGLGVAPSLIITKPRANPYGWTSYHASLGNTQYIELNTTSAAATNSTVWNNTSPTSSVFTLGSAFAGNGTYVAYCWTPIAGFSAFGSYTGNGSTDGPFIYLGFRPRWILMKGSSAVTDWHLFDTARDPYNVSQANLSPNTSDAEGTFSTRYFDFLSNGIKLRTTANPNSSGVTYIYMAFAESPFKNSLAR